MAFNLIEGEAGAVPITVLSKAGLEAWRDTAPARERDWAAATGFTGEAGKLALVPDKAGKLGRVLVGVGEDEAAMWALAGLSDDGSRWAIRHEFTRTDGKLCARVTSVGGWLELKARKLVMPPEDMLAVTKMLSRTEDFSTLPSSIKAS